MNRMGWLPHLDSDSKNIVVALAESLEAGIHNGVLKPNEKLPPQRELADFLGVNLSTVTRAFKYCELKGLIYGVVGRGTFVSPDARMPISVAEPAGVGCIEMGQVLPLYALDQNIVKAAASMLMAADLERVMRYLEPQGHISHRTVGAEWLKTFRIAAQPDDVVVTPGSQNAAAVSFLTLFQRGDRIAVDALTYPGIKTLAALYGMRLVPIEADGGGMSAQGLLHACRNEDIRGIYLMPEMQNPTTGLISNVRREELADVIRRHRIILIEDDAYAFTGDPDSVPLSAMVPEQGIYIAGTSKLFSPAFRISYVSVPCTYREAYIKGLQSTNWMASPVTAEVVTLLVSLGYAGEAVRAKRAEAQRRNGMAREILAGYDVASRPHGFFQWLTLPERWRDHGRSFEFAAREAGVRVFCAEKFAVGSAPVPQAVRLSLSGPFSSDLLEKGLQIIKRVLDSEYDPGAIL